MSTSQDAAPAPDDADAAVSLASAEAGTTARGTLIAPALWRSLEPAEDPFADRPAQPRCSPSALMAEMLSGELVFSVNTGDCDYVTVRQATLREASSGETLRVRLWHFELNAPEAAEAHVALTLDGLTVMDERVPIPQSGALITKELTLGRTIAAGAPAYFHLHNHGANSWALVELSSGP